MPHPKGRWDPPTWASVHGADPAEVRRCPGCRRQVRADALRDLRACPEAGQDFGCDGCLTRLDRTGVLSTATFARLAGAPKHIRDHLEAKARRR